MWKRSGPVSLQAAGRPVSGPGSTRSARSRRSAIACGPAASDFDAEDFRNACEKAGILHDPKGLIGDEDEYIQIVRPGILSLPHGFRTTEIDRYGHLVAERPPAELIVASKLSRGSDTDLEDAAWWVANAGLSLQAVENAIRELPRKTDRETADENLIFLKLSHSGED